MRITDNIFYKTIIAGVVATAIWWIAYYFNQNPRGLDWWFLFSSEYLGVSLIYVKSQIKGSI